MKRGWGLLLLCVCVLAPVAVMAGDVADYLILQDIGPYRVDRPEKSLPGEPPSGGPNL